MSDRFRIYLDDDPEDRCWVLDYPDGFDPHSSGLTCSSFNDAVAEFIAAANRRCIICGRGAVEDRPWGWKCTACNSFDIASDVECTCASTEGSQSSCVLHSENGPEL